MSKKFIYKIYTNAGVFIKTLPIGISVTPSVNDELVLNTPQITSEINGGQNSLSIVIDTKFDDFDEGISIKHGNRVELYIVDKNNTLGKLIHTGLILSYRPLLGANKQQVTIISASHIASLSQPFYKSVGAEIFQKSAIKASDLFKDIIDSFRVDYPNSNINYDGSSVEDSSVNLTLDFEYKKCREAIKEAIESAPAGWWWSIDGTGLASFKTKPSTSTHTFTVGAHVDQVELDKSIESVVNKLYLKWSGGTTEFIDATSVSDYGLREKYIDKSSEITDATTRDEFGNSYISDHKDLKRRMSKPIVINNSYNIENIKAGDTCKILGMKINQNPFVSNMQIVKVAYNGTTAQLTLEEDFLNFAKQVKN